MSRHPFITFEEPLYALQKFNMVGQARTAHTHVIYGPVEIAPVQPLAAAITQPVQRQTQSLDSVCCSLQ